MPYIIGLTLAFIFGYLYGRERERWKIDDATPLDVKLTEQDLLGGDTILRKPETKDTIPDVDWINAAMYYPHKGGGMWN